MIHEHSSLQSSRMPRRGRMMPDEEIFDFTDSRFLKPPMVKSHVVLIRTEFYITFQFHRKTWKTFPRWILWISEARLSWLRLQWIESLRGHQVIRGHPIIRCQLRRMQVILQGGGSDPPHSRYSMWPWRQWWTTCPSYPALDTCLRTLDTCLSYQIIDTCLIQIWTLDTCPRYHKWLPGQQSQSSELSNHLWILARVILVTAVRLVTNCQAQWDLSDHAGIPGPRWEQGLTFPHEGTQTQLPPKYCSGRDKNTVNVIIIFSHIQNSQFPRTSWDYLNSNNRTDYFCHLVLLPWVNVKILWPSYRVSYCEKSCLCICTTPCHWIVLCYAAANWTQHFIDLFTFPPSVITLANVIPFPLPGRKQHPLHVDILSGSDQNAVGNFFMTLSHPSREW